MDQSIPLPNEWIARLFERFRAIYGNRLDQMFGAADPATLTATWAQELSSFAADDLRKALENTALHHQEFPPTLYQFSALCRDARRARAQTAVKVEDQRREPTQKERDRVHELIQRMAAQAPGRAWAHKILERHANGETLPQISLDFAREALGMVES